VKHVKITVRGQAASHPWNGAIEIATAKKYKELQNMRGRTDSEATGEETREITKERNTYYL
jgi:hypothetical protein